MLFCPRMRHTVVRRARFYRPQGLKPGISASGPARLEGVSFQSSLIWLMNL
jgi:hypothetical protein